MADKTLEEFVKGNIRVFKRMLCLYYPITDEILTKFFGKTSDGAINWDELSKNENINWTKEFITKYKQKIEWDNLSANPKVFAGREKEMLELFKNEIRWNYLSSNPGVKFTKDLIDKYADKIDFVELSQNRSVEWTEEILIKYGKKLSWKHIRLNPGIKWTREMIDNVRKGTGNEDIELLYLTEAEGMAWSEKDLDEFKNHDYAPMAWDKLSANEGLPWSMALYNKYKDFFYLNRMSKLRKFPWTEDFIAKHAEKWDWMEMSSNTSLPFSEAFIKKFEKKWMWASSGRDEWRLTGLSGNPALPWSEKLIDAFITKWAARTITQNPGLPWSIEFINKYKDKLRLFMNELHTNKGIWEKAIKPLVNDAVIGELFTKYYFPA
ncbi:MAG: hypothetical protein GYA24_02635 [Candidatus Lokiarchaeota archaeon]|nr:hypothetical protein [Candidatus Lokiarchaeota archaeon]